MKYFTALVTAVSNLSFKIKFARIIMEDRKISKLSCLEIFKNKINYKLKISGLAISQ